MRFAVYVVSFLTIWFFTSCSITSTPTWWEENYVIDGEYIYSYGIGIDISHEKAREKSETNARTDLQKTRNVNIKSELTVLGVKDNQFRESIVYELKEKSIGTIIKAEVCRTEYFEKDGRVIYYSEIRINRYDLFPEERLTMLEQTGYVENDLKQLRMLYDRNGYNKLSLLCRKILAEKSILYKLEMIDYYVKENFISQAFTEISLLKNEIDTIGKKYHHTIIKKYDLIKNMLPDLSWHKLKDDFEKLVKSKEKLTDFNIHVTEEVGVDVNLQINVKYTAYLYLFYIDTDGLYLLDIDNSNETKINPPGRKLVLPGYGLKDFTLFGVYLSTKDNRLINWKEILKKEFDSKEEKIRDKARFRFQQLIEHLKSLFFTSANIKN